MTAPSRIPDDFLLSVNPDIFWSHVCVGSDDVCWPWIRATTEAGYGIFSLTVNGQRHQVLAHRVAYLLGTGNPLGKLDSCHHCDNPPCCNYRSHLFAGTNHGNRLDSMYKGRTSGPKQLTAKDVAEIKYRYGNGETSIDLARYFNVKDRQIRRLVSGTSQKNDPTPLSFPEWKVNGFRKAQTKLSDEQIIELRARYAAGGVTQQQLANEYSLNRCYVNQIILGNERRGCLP